MVSRGKEIATVKMSIFHFRKILNRFYLNVNSPQKSTIFFILMLINMQNVREIFLRIGVENRNCLKNDLVNW